MEIPQVLDRYRIRGGRSASTLRQAGAVWVRLIAPITPHLAEEAYAQTGQGLVAEAPFPREDELPSDPRSLLKESLLEGLEEDLASLRKGWKGTPSGLRVFVAAPWKYRLETWLASRPNPSPAPRGALLKELLQDPEFASHRAEVPRYLDLILPGGRPGIQTLPELSPAEELTILRQAHDYVGHRLGGLAVEVVLEEEGAARDPQGRRARARPGRPALYLWSDPDSGSGKRVPSDSSSR
ncbi:leucyl-tRNA synthetase [mine drainage metagenome]|uniref:Leucyl-tRNA synthetase n=1 Tax=mine drainage metagenome TaxID=410659 RepID=T0Z533_9ZZZZ